MRRLTVVLIASLALVAAACGDDDAESADSTTTTAAEATTTTAAPATTVAPTTEAPTTTAAPATTAAPTTAAPKAPEPVALGGTLEQTLVADPYDGVKGGDVIAVEMTKFLPNTEVTVVVCFEWPAVGPASCDLSNYGDFTVTTDADGAATIDYTIQDVIEGGTCDPSNECMIVGGTGIGPPTDTITYGGYPMNFV